MAPATLNRPKTHGGRDRSDVGLQEQRDREGDRDQSAQRPFRARPAVSPELSM
jgi:hypothetical protein